MGKNKTYIVLIGNEKDFAVLGVTDSLHNAEKFVEKIIKALERNNAFINSCVSEGDGSTVYDKEYSWDIYKNKDQFDKHMDSSFWLKIWEINPKAVLIYENTLEEIEWHQI